MTDHLTAIEPTQHAPGKTVVLIHGAWMVPASWDRFKSRFEADGYRVLTPTWPLMDRPVEELRSHPHPDFGALTVGRIADHLEMVIRALPEQPLLVGHSFGGLLVQILLDRGLGRAGIAIDPAPIAGVIPGPVPLAAAFPILARWKGWSRPFVLTREAFDRNFANTAPQAQRDEEYDRLVVPSPGAIFFQAASMIGTRVDTRNRRQPLLVVAGEKDRTVTPNLAWQAYRLQRKARARTDFVEFPGVSHYLVAEPGWEKVADKAIAWDDEMRV